MCISSLSTRHFASLPNFYVYVLLGLSQVFRKAENEVFNWTSDLLKAGNAELKGFELTP